MAEPYVWGALPRTVGDPTVIDEAIETAINAHNDDPDAHLGEDQALQSHRAAEIIDHAAESVVNDKIVADARAYTAIVDPSTEYDYATIESALAYVVSKGGGTILIKAGEHFIDEQITVPRGVNMTGEGIGVTNVYGVVDGLPAINLEGGITEDTAQTVFEGITFVRTLGNIFTGENQLNSGKPGIYFRDCSFENGGKYGLVVTNDFAFESCIFDTTTTAALDVVSIYARQCIFTSSVAGIAMTQDATAADGGTAVFYDCYFESNGSQHMTGAWRNSMMINTTFIGVSNTVPAANTGCLANKFFGCTFSAKNDNDMYIDGSVLAFTGCGFTADEYDDDDPKIRLRSSSRQCVFANNYVIHLPTDSGSGNSVVNNVERLTDVPPAPIGENISYSATRNVNVTSTVGGYPGGITRTGEYFIGRTNTAPGGTTRAFRWNGTTYAQIYTATQDVSGTVTKRMNRRGTRFFIAEDWSTSNLRISVFEISGSTVTLRRGDISSLGYRVKVCDCDDAGAVLVGVRSTGARIVQIITRATATYTMGAAYTLPGIVVNGSTVTPNADDAWFSNDSNRVYVRAGGGAYLYILDRTGTTLSLVQALKVDETGTFTLLCEKADGSLVVDLSVTPFIKEFTYDNGSYAVLTTFMGEASSDVRSIVEATTDGSLAVTCYDSGLKIFMYRKSNEEYIRSDNGLVGTSSTIYATPVNADSGTIVSNDSGGNQIGTASFDP